MLYIDVARVKKTPALRLLWSLAFVNSENTLIFILIILSSLLRVNWSNMNIYNYM